MKKIHFIILILCLNQLQAQVQPEKKRLSEDSFKTRKLILGSVQASLWSGSFLALNKAWYANYPKSSFHFYNDSREWLQMDKLGHSWSTYQISQHTSKIWQWAGTSHKNSVIIGSLSGMAYLSIIEILDGYSDKWGFSGYDVLANASGAGLYGFQELAWQEQRIKMKLSYFPVEYGTLDSRADALFGAGFIEKILKDYNGQTYWLSFNLKSFFSKASVPSWLNFAVGYRAGTMLGGYENTWKESNGYIIDRTDIKRIRKFHLSLDVDLSRIKVKNKKVQTILSILNVLKIPSPSFEIDAKGKFRFHPLYF